jgi:2-polyprenyl-6-methoxyphenol hydroxylase-like FAD-dependent oxidoreductase
MNAQERAEVPVLIVGAGPVGLTLACELAIAGVPATLIERLDAANDRSPGMAINTSVVELLQQRGLMEAMRDDGFEFPLAHFAHVMLEPTRLKERHPYAFAVPHFRLAQRLEEQAVRLGTRIVRGTELVSLDGDEDGVTASTSSGEVFRCRYLVGCDGGGSRVRALAGIGFPGTELDFRGITGDLEVGADDPLMLQLGFHQHDAGLFTVAPAAPGVARVTVGEFGIPPARPGTPVMLSEFQDSVKRVTGNDLISGHARWITGWGASSRVADRYRADRVFLAGDAAHLCFPLGGQALSTGIEDAVNLGWKLAAEINGWAPDGLLFTYHTERHPVGERMCKTTQAQTALMYQLDKVGPLREILAELITLDDVNEYLVKMVGGLDVQYQMDDPELTGTGLAGTGLAGSGPLTGRRLADIPLTTSEGDTSVARLLQAGHGLLLDFADDAGLQRLATGWGDRLDLVTAEPAPELDATAILVRPDGRVAWSSRHTEIWGTGLSAAMYRWFGEPGSRQAH